MIATMEVDDSINDKLHMTDSGCDNILTSATDLSSGSDIKLYNRLVEEEEKLQSKEKHHNEAKLEDKFLIKEIYNNELHEQRYKRLMHLLKKSKFYSTFLMNKIETEKITKKKGKRPFVNDENEPPSKKRMIKKQVQFGNRQFNLTKEEIKAELSMDIDTEIKEVSTSSKAIVPKYFHGDLRNYQQAGLEWLKLLYENALNGILADEMGLGKTIQVIAMLCHLIEKKQPGPYLIIAPLSTIPNWLIEFERFAPDIPIVQFHSSLDERMTARKEIQKRHYVKDGYSTQPVVITSYEVTMHEIKFFRSQHWRYIVIDEGHRIKNHKCILINLLKTIKSMNKLILTGTPLQNNLTELWSLLNFLLPDIFDDLAVFESWFDVNELQNQKGTAKLLKQEEEKQVLLSLREILRPFMLRRVKADVCLDIPSKKELIVYAPLTELQYELYQAVLNYDLQTLSKIEKPDLIVPTVDGEKPKRKSFLKSKYGSAENTEYLQKNENSSNTDEWKAEKHVYQNNLSRWKQYTNITDRNKDFLICIQFHNRLPMYKKIVNHPYLIHCPLNSDSSPKIDEDFIRSSGKLLVLDAMLSKLKMQGHKVLLFSTMTMVLDMIEDYLSLRDYNYVRLDGHVKINERKENIQNFNNNPNIFLFLISTRAGGVGLNLASADTVIIYDSDWNPQADIQAMARCHRIGQTKPVVVYRLCTRGTIDEVIIKRAETKRILEKMVISKQWRENNSRKDILLQMKQLMESKENKIVTFESEVFTEAELNRLLDRSDMINNHNAHGSQE